MTVAMRNKTSLIRAPRWTPSYLLDSINKVSYLVYDLKYDLICICLFLYQILDEA